MMTIIDYGMGNLNSIANMFKKIGVSSIITNKKEEINQSHKLILPGVGSFDKAMQNIKELDLLESLNNKVIFDKTPILGICLGMQLLTNSSEEGEEQGFGWLDAETKKFNHQALKIPHMGWNSITIEKSSSMFNHLDKERRYYFVHSYYVECHDEKDILTTTDYGHPFTSMVEKGNIYGAQFHPEKSHAFGIELLTNFAKL